MQYNSMYIEVPHPLYISYVSVELTKQVQHQATLEAAVDKGQWFKKVTKVNESKQWKENLIRNLLSEEF